MEAAGGESSTQSGSAPPEAAAPLPPPRDSWPFQQQSTELAAKVIGALGLPAGFVARMIRAVLLDKTIYREVAADASLKSEAWQVMGVVIILSSGGLLLPSVLNFSLSALSLLVRIAVVQVVIWPVRIWLIQVVASAWLKTPTTFNQFFRALSYAQSPVALGFVPVVGQVIGLWSLVTNTAAIRDVTGCDTKNAAVLTVVGFAGAMAVTFLVSQFV
jgi:hypothetical protein